MAADALANPSAIPVTGEIHEELLPLDAIMLEQVREKRCTSAILAVERNGAILACRGYGWQDRQATRPINPFARMRPVGLGHVFARAAASMMVRNGKVALETKILNYLGFGDSPMSVPDSRAFKITVRDAIEERLGWDEEHRLDAVWKQMDASARSRLLTVNDFIARMVKQPLQFEPGEKAIADCFGDILLRGVVEKAAEKEFAAALKDVFEECGPTHLGPSLPEDRAGDEEVCYGPPTNNEPPFALFHRQLAMSAVDLSRFARYWGGGDKWSGGRANWVGFWWWSYSELAIQYNVWADGAICVQMFNGQVDCNEVAGRLRKVLDERADRCFLTHASSSPAPTANATSNTSPSPR
jgi:CubicO group peptidase (beta-lactamase class C family)